MTGCPQDGEYPKPYNIVKVVTQPRAKDNHRLHGYAYWTGFRWMGVRGFRIGLYQVVKWETENA